MARTEEVLARFVTVDYQTRTLYAVGEICDDMVLEFLPAFRRLDGGAKPITIVLVSDGGSMDAGFAMYDAIRLARNHTRIEGLGAIQSMASLVLQAGDERVLAPSCTFMIHPPTVSVEDKRIEALIGMVKDCEMAYEKYCQILSARSSTPVKKIKRLCEQETYMSAEEAVEAGFADEVMKKA